MTCKPFGGAIVCGPDPTGYRKRYIRCSFCQCTTEMVVHYDLWYGASYRCCRCGDAWDDGELLPRPFARGWRQRAVARHRKLWDRASHGPPPSFEDELAAMDEAAAS